MAFSESKRAAIIVPDYRHFGVPGCSCLAS